MGPIVAEASLPQHVTVERQYNNKAMALKHEPPPLLAKLSYAAHIYGLQSFIFPYLWVREWKEYFYPPDGGPNIIKAYEVRPRMPIRIFFPQSYDQTSPQTLPTLFTIHGGGFCIGHNRDDDEWNRHFADSQNTLVISLNYSKSPTHPFPTALHDLEALLLAALADESLPIDRSLSPASMSRTAILGFSAGGNLALSLAQLPCVRLHANAPAAAISVYGCLDLSVNPASKLVNRPHKPSLAPPRGGGNLAGQQSDPLEGLAPTFDWSYIPYGHDLRDPLLSPAFAPATRLPPFVCLVAAELDMLAHESWRLACRLSRDGGAKRVVPDRMSKNKSLRICGREEVGRRKGALEDARDERFGFEDYWNGGRGGVKWLLVPDVLHGFDNPQIRGLLGGEETVKDAEMKTRAYLAELGDWLRARVWML